MTKIRLAQQVKASQEQPSTVQEAEAELKIRKALEARARAEAEAKRAELESQYGIGGARYYIKRNSVGAKARQSGLKKSHDRLRTARVRAREMGRVASVANGRHLTAVPTPNDDALGNQNGNVIALAQRDNRL